MQLRFSLKIANTHGPFFKIECFLPTSEKYNIIFDNTL